MGTKKLDPRRPQVVKVSQIASQFYCEYKVHLEWVRPEQKIVTQAMKQGSAVHQHFEDQAVRLSAVDIEKRLEKGDLLTQAELAMEGEIEGVRLVGKADAVVYDQNRAFLIVEYKTSKRAQIFDDQRAQLGLYGLLLEQKGLDVSQLWLALVFTHPDSGQANRFKEPLEQRERVVAEIMKTRDGLANRGDTKMSLTVCGENRDVSIQSNCIAGVDSAQISLLAQ